MKSSQMQSNQVQSNGRSPALLTLVLVWCAGLMASGIAPYDRPTWLLEVAPCLILMPVLWATRGRFQFSNFVYAMVMLHGLILMLGGAYTYARVPLGFWMQDWFHTSRNDYDKIGHFAQGFVARELLLRVFKLPSRGLIAWLAVAIALAISALYELLEWGAAVALGAGADEFLATQGYVWDTQSDMLMALIGASCAMLLVRWHDHSIEALGLRAAPK
jgi:putative membrane protein